MLLELEHIYVWNSRELGLKAEQGRYILKSYESI